MQIARITHDPAVMGGKPCIRGLRVTVGTILGLLASNQTHNQVRSGLVFEQHGVRPARERIGRRR